MTLEADQIKANADSAIENNAEKPNFTEVYKLLSNNTTAQEQKQERTAFNGSLHQKFPDLDLIGEESIKDTKGQSQDALLVFDRQSLEVQARSTTDFTIIDKKDMSADIKAKKLTPEQASEAMAANLDKSIESAANSGQANQKPQEIPSQKSPVSPEKPNSETSASPGKVVEKPGESPASKKPTDQTESEREKPATPVEANAGRQGEKTYQVKPGDCLWNIARAQLQGEEAQKKEVTDASIQEYVDKIVEKNKIENPDLIYPEQTLNLPKLEEASDAASKEEPSERPKDRAINAVEAIKQAALAGAKDSVAASTPPDVNLYPEERYDTDLKTTD